MSVEAAELLLVLEGLDLSRATRWTLERLREQFGVVGDDPMFDSYPVGSLQAKALGHDIGKDLAASGLKVFVEADAEE